MQRSYIAAVVLTLLLLALVVLYVFEFYYLNRTLEARRLVTVALAIGALSGAAVAWRLRRQATDDVERVQLFAFCIVLAALFAPLFASLSNRLLSPYGPGKVTVEYIAEAARYADRFGALDTDERPRANQFFLFFSLDGEIYRVRRDGPLPVKYERGDSVEIVMRRGLWSEVVGDR